MLVELRITGLGAIDDVSLSFGPGFTAVTGETGAGKTMLLSGLALLLGGRADAGLVRSGHTRAAVEGRFRVPADGDIAPLVHDAGGDLDGDELIVARTVGSDGRSRGFLGGRSVPAATLAKLADRLVTVHGQSEQRGLLRSSVQREAIDRYAGNRAADLLTSYRSAFTALAAVRHELTGVVEHRRERALEADALRHGLQEIDGVEPLSGEDERLRQDSARLAHAESLRLAATTGHRLLNAADSTAGDSTDDALNLLSRCRQELATVAGHDPALDALGTRLADAVYQIADIATDLAAYADSVESDPARLATIEARRSQLQSLTRKYAGDIDGVLTWADTARGRLARLDDDDDRVAELTARRDDLLQRLAESGAQLSRLRTAAAAEVAASVTSELHGLGMPGARLDIVVTQRDDPQGLPIGDRTVAFGSAGLDEVEFLLSGHTGAPLRPLHKSASGGELSRVMLALELILARGADADCFVFDEVDAGVGGRAAVEVGRRLAALSRSAQVLVVTHLPQVAAFADHHLVVTKAMAVGAAPDGTGGDTAGESVIDLVDGESRLRELSRMLGGIEDSDLARGHAAELLEVADAARAGR